MLKFILILFLSALSLAKPQEVGIPAAEQPRELKDIGIEEKLGSQLDLAILVKNEKGESVPLASFFGRKKPVILSLVYFSCPGLCNFHLNGLTDGLKKLDWNIGNQFEVLTLSFDAKETADLAAKKKVTYLETYARAGIDRGWHFLTSDEENLKKLTESVGFKFKWDAQAKEWAHASAAIVFTPDGQVSRYLHGIIFEPQDLKLALIEAAGGKIATFKEKLLWFCYKYDPHTSKYALVATQVMKLGGGLFVLLMMAILIPFWLRSRKENPRVEYSKN